MPGGDKTGPQGEGSQTGRQAGYCSGNEQPGYGRPGFGRRNFRRFRRFERWPEHMPAQDDAEKSLLVQEVRELKALVTGLQKKVDHLEK